MLSKQYDQLIRDTVLDGWNEKRLSVLQCAFAAVEAVLAQRTEPAPAQDHLGADRTDEWESRMDAQKQAAQPIQQSAGNNSSGAEQINVPQCTAPVQQSAGAEDVVERMAIAGRNAVDTCTVGNMLNLGWTQAMTAALAVARPVIEAERDKQWAAWGTVEVAVRNPSVSDYMKHWEERAAKAEAARAEETRQFKNFHRNLCERFNYCHDEIDWKRDQASLEEHIADTRKGLHSKEEIEKALQDEVEQWPGYESWYKRFTKNVLARLSQHPSQQADGKEMR